MARQLTLKVDLTPPPNLNPKKSRKKGGGRRPRLSDKEIARLQRAYGRMVKRDPTLKKQEPALAELRPLLPESKRNVSDPTLLRHVVRPVLTKDSK
jgi:hypothetical protein